MAQQSDYMAGHLVHPSLVTTVVTAQPQVQLMAHPIHGRVQY